MGSEVFLDLAEMGSALPWQGGMGEDESGDTPGVPKGGQAPPDTEGKWAAGGDLGVSRGLEGSESSGGGASKSLIVGVVGRVEGPLQQTTEAGRALGRGLGGRGRSSPGSRSGWPPRCTRRLSCSTSCGALRRKVSSRRSMLTSALSNSIRQ